MRYIIPEKVEDVLENEREEPPRGKVEKGYRDFKNLEYRMMKKKTKKKWDDKNQAALEEERPRENE